MQKLHIHAPVLEVDIPTAIYETALQFVSKHCRFAVLRHAPVDSLTLRFSQSCDHIQRHIGMGRSGKRECYARHGIDLGIFTISEYSAGFVGRKKLTAESQRVDIYIYISICKTDLN